MLRFAFGKGLLNEGLGLHHEGLRHVVGLVSKLVHTVEKIVEGLVSPFVNLDRFVFGYDVGDLEIWQDVGGRRLMVTIVEVALFEGGTRVGAICLQ